MLLIETGLPRQAMGSIAAKTLLTSISIILLQRWGFGCRDRINCGGKSEGGG
jgi:hypothetical protein